MADFLGRLAARSLGKFPVAQPVVSPIFSPADAAEQRQPVLNPGIRPSEAGLPSAATAEPSQTSENEAIARTSNSLATPVRAEPAASIAPLHLHPGTLQLPTQPLPHEPFLDATLKETATMPFEQDEASAKPPSVVPGHQPPTPEILQTVLHPGTKFHPGETLPFLPNETRPRDSATRERASAPSVRVTIGRVEVRAEFPAPPARPAVRRSEPAMLSLEEYARQRREGKR